MHRWPAGRDEGLVKFVGGAVQSRREQGHSRAPPIGDRRVGLMLRHGMPEKNAQNPIFPEMAALANAEVDEFESLCGDMGKEPEQQRSYNAARVAGGESIGGSHKDDNHPAKDENPSGKAGAGSHGRDDRQKARIRKAMRAMGKELFTACE